MTGIEPVTPSLPRKYSTPELHRLLQFKVQSLYKQKTLTENCILNMSGRPGSNRPPIAWKAIALPNELLPLLILYLSNAIGIYTTFLCGESRIRTYEGIRQQIYSLLQLAALVFPHPQQNICL
jgi:hypothetical protein